MSAMRNRQCKIFVTKNCRSNLDFHFAGWHHDGPPNGRPKNTRFYYVFSESSPRNTLAQLRCSCSRTIAFGVIELLFVELLSQARGSVEHYAGLESARWAPASRVTVCITAPPAEAIPRVLYVGKHNHSHSPESDTRTDVLLRCHRLQYRWA